MVSNNTAWWLSQPLWKIMEFKSVGMMIFPNMEKSSSHVPNHQAAILNMS